MRSRHLIAEALSATASTEREKVRAALDWLVAQPAAARAFVVLSHPTALRSIGDPKFVQFCVQRGGLLLDLPECALDEREQAAAQGVFGDPKQVSLAEICSGAVSSLFTFQLACGDDVETAVGLALVTFVHVFRVEPVFVVECGHTEGEGGGGGGQALPRPPIEGVLPEVTS